MYWSQRKVGVTHCTQRPADPAVTAATPVSQIYQYRYAEKLIACSKKKKSSHFCLTTGLLTEVTVLQTYWRCYCWSGNSWWKPFPLLLLHIKSIQFYKPPGGFYCSAAMGNMIHLSPTLTAIAIVWGKKILPHKTWIFLLGTFGGCISFNDHREECQEKKQTQWGWFLVLWKTNCFMCSKRGSGVSATRWVRC